VPNGAKPGKHPAADLGRKKAVTAGGVGVNMDLVYYLDQIDGHEFEDVMAEIFRRFEFDVERGKLSNDEGRDLILRKASAVAVVECKHQKAAVGRPVLQKLHSAAITFPNATAAILVTTGWFSEAAKEYAKSLNERFPLRISLWDMSVLVEQARKVGVFLISDRQEVDPFFIVPPRTLEQFSTQAWQRHFAALKSSPRPLHQAITFGAFQEEVVPALVVEYSVDKIFETQAGVIRHVAESGQRFVPTHGVSLTASETTFFSHSTPQRLTETHVFGKPVASLFGLPVQEWLARVREKQARRLSEYVSYSGRNNQSYTKYCEVHARDVLVASRQTVFFRKHLSFRVGPRKYAASFADDRSQPLLVTGLSGFPDGGGGFVAGDGFVCNDCGVISPSSGANGGASCQRCSRTLCAMHHWRYPRRAPNRWCSLCHTCYLKEDANEAQNDALAVQYSLLQNVAISGLLAIVPGLPFILGKRWISGIVLLSIFFLLVLPLWGLSAYAGALATALTLAVSIGASCYWSFRLRCHASNLARISGYAPQWQDTC
jgi:hypothetical protein